eukprot:gene14164-579_t
MISLVISDDISDDISADDSSQMISQMISLQMISLHLCRWQCVAAHQLQAATTSSHK